jgi:hypothetical protein
MRKNSKKRPDLWRCGWTLHQNTAQAHEAILVHQFLARKQIPTLEHYLYSPDLASCDFLLSAKSKNLFKCTHFQSFEDVHKKTVELFKALPQNDFQRCFKAWKHHMGWCVASVEITLKGVTCRCNNLVIKVIFKPVSLLKSHTSYILPLV